LRKFNHQNSRVIDKRSGDRRFKSRRGAQIDFAADAYYGDPFLVRD
jgi:hypothetical protein